MCDGAGWTKAAKFVSHALSSLVYGEHKEEGLDAAPKLHQCLQLNVSVCDASSRLAAGGKPFLVVVYNPLAWNRTAPVRVPLPATDSDAWTVSGGWPLPSTGQTVVFDCT